ncbi:MAG TPA: hypothetical protein VNM90_26940 [Haliangium sp.]|nr:hypothetical protein [Haliangium sp.]
MLRALERYLQPLVQAALPGGTSVVTGPYQPSGIGAVVLHAHTLRVEPPPAEAEGDDPGHVVEHVTWPADGQLRDFALPESVTGELVEVESPPGRLVKAGDAYYLEQRTIRFYRPPAAASPAVRARIRGAEAAGYSRRQRCTLGLELAVWATSMTTADDRLGVILPATLAALIAVPILEADPVAGTGVSLRIMSPRVLLAGMRRAVQAEPALFHAHAEIELRAELDLMVAHGAPEPVGIIEQVAHDITVVVPADDDAP